VEDFREMAMAMTRIKDPACREATALHLPAVSEVHQAAMGPVAKARVITSPAQAVLAALGALAVHPVGKVPTPPLCPNQLPLFF
jgi:hypothetical protein